MVWHSCIRSLQQRFPASSRTRFGITRALARIQGNREARIFCTHLDAELVSVAGIYSVSEDIDDELRGRAAQVYLEDGQLRIEAL